MKEKELFNKMEISALIDEVSYDLDQKDLDRALKNFSEDARLNVVENGQTISTLEGKKAICESLGSRMDSMTLLFHNNGTKVIELINLDQSALASTSCIVKMITKTAVTDEDLYYHDKLIRFNGSWYIVERTVEILVKSVH